MTTHNTREEVVKRKIAITRYLRDVYGLNDNDTLSAGEVEELSEMLVEHFLTTAAQEKEEAVKAAKIAVLKDIETIAVRTGCDYASAINRYMNNNEISEEAITPPKNISSNETMV